jgi:hypothetical protein
VTFEKCNPLHKAHANIRHLLSSDSFPNFRQHNTSALIDLIVSLIRFRFYLVPGQDQYKMSQGHLKIKSLEDLSQVLASFRDDPNLALSIRALDVEENDLEDASNEDGGETVVGVEHNTEDYAARNAAQAQGFCDGIASIVQEIAQNGRLESFKWKASYYRAPIPTRPKTFWEALSKTAATLKALHLNFYTHEIHALRQQKLNPMPSPFLELECLSLVMDGGHGDDAKDFDNMLRNIPKLRSLTLSLPSCDLEKCRIQGLTYDWNFPFLSHSNLSAYINDDSGVPAFLTRHPSIQSLKYDVESDSPISIPFTSLPNLKALFVSGFSQVQKCVEEARAIKQLCISTSLGTTPCDLSPASSSALSCLEIETSYWNEEMVRSQISDLLPNFANLIEVGIEFQSDNLTWYEDGKEFHLDPMDVGLLVRTYLWHITGHQLLNTRK